MRTRREFHSTRGRFLAPGVALAALALTFAIGLRPGAAGPSGARSQGEDLAQMVCSACHVVAIHQDRPPILRNAAPDFCDIANRPNTTTSSLAHFITHTHRNEASVAYQMPNPMLYPDQAKAVSRYILSLRGNCDFASGLTEH